MATASATGSPMRTPAKLRGRAQGNPGSGGSPYRANVRDALKEGTDAKPRSVSPRAFIPYDPATDGSPVDYTSFCILGQIAGVPLPSESADKVSWALVSRIGGSV